LHGAVVNFLNSMRHHPGLTEQDVLAAVTTLSFDIAGLELFLPLSVGARIVLIDSQVTADGPRLAQVLQECGATVMQATPSTWQLLRDADGQTPRHLKVLCGGEALPRNLAEYLLDRASSIWNMYGPTETTIWSATHRVESGARGVPIGHPIDNTQLYILDPCLNPVPVGVPGELFIGGVGLARGYRNLPELTAEKFIANPFSDGRGDRLYKTGDLARYLPDGNIEFLGRIDHQVKLRGFRIELEEIEMVLSKIPGIREAVVIVREEDADKRLIAYTVPDRDSVPTIGELRNLLKAKLPDYMIPSAFVFLDALPLTSNGKLDRSALPALDRHNSNLQETFIAPRTSAEKTIAEIWVQTLKQEPVGIHDNFFDLGGHSLLATRLISRIRQAFEIELPLRTLFENPTVAGLAAQVDRLKVNGEPSNELADVLTDIESLSDEEAERLIAQGNFKTSD
jgi:acyl-coenzyme A synthetase/AMP-(fatty) acid ligase/acyl carrier protein